MRIRSAEFTVAAYGRKDFPRGALPEIALVGRSNVGKSSLINALAGRKSLARTSSTPGKTQSINFYLVNGAFYLVDLPGFGYARVPERVRRSWRRMIDSYMEGRRTIRGVMVILDSRRKIGETEAGLYEWIEALGLPVITVVTKADKLPSAKLRERVREIKAVLGVDAPVVFSATKGLGRKTLLRRIGELVTGDEKGT